MVTNHQVKQDLPGARNHELPTITIMEVSSCSSFMEQHHSSPGAVEVIRAAYPVTLSQ